MHDRGRLETYEDFFLFFIFICLLFISFYIFYICLGGKSRISGVGHVSRIRIRYKLELPWVSSMLFVYLIFGLVRLKAVGMCCSQGGTCDQR
jgi:hypothetical protein